MLKAELHCHMEGAADPLLVMRLAGKYGIDLSDIVRDNAYVWNDFTSFLQSYDKASTVFRSGGDYRLLAYDYFTRLAAQDAIYGEVFASPDHSARMGIGFDELISAMSEGIADAERETGIVGRIVATCVRHLGPESAELVAEQCAMSSHDYLTGFGMAGDERMYQPEDFATAFAIAADAGLGLTAHAGEFAGPESVRGVLEHLNVSRIGHGVRMIEDPDLTAEVAEMEIVLEICAGSNIALGVYSDVQSHPLSLLESAGVRVCLNSDDPPYFSTSLAQEYEIARQSGLDDASLRQCTRTAVEAAFVDEQTRGTLLNKLDNID